MRVQLLVFPLMLIAALLADMRPRLLVALALAAAFAYNTVPYGLMAAQRTESVYRARTAWLPALAFLQRHEGPNFRVEVVPTAEHWEAYYVPAAGFALARGWYRQLDLAQNPLLYGERIAAPAYRAWLRRLGIRYVLLPRAGLDGSGARPEAALLASGASGLRPVLRRPALDDLRAAAGDADPLRPGRSAPDRARPRPDRRLDRCAAATTRCACATCRTGASSRAPSAWRRAGTARRRSCAAATAAASCSSRRSAPAR